MKYTAIFEIPDDCIVIRDKTELTYCNSKNEVKKIVAKAKPYEYTGRVISANKLISKLVEIKTKSESNPVKCTLNNIIEYVDYFANKYGEYN